MLVALHPVSCPDWPLRYAYRQPRMRSSSWDRQRRTPPPSDPTCGFNVLSRHSTRAYDQNSTCSIHLQTFRPKLRNKQPSAIAIPARTSWPSPQLSHYQTRARRRFLPRRPPFRQPGRPKRTTRDTSSLPLQFPRPSPESSGRTNCALGNERSKPDRAPCRTIFSTTLPARRCSTNRSRCLPMTLSSTSSSAAHATISSPGPPARAARSRYSARVSCSSCGSSKQPRSSHYAAQCRARCTVRLGRVHVGALFEQCPHSRLSAPLRGIRDHRLPVPATVPPNARVSAVTSPAILVK